ncbi:hypothetical protein OE88DRAFT_1268076 [Heliocybe sulcata]|uniref:DRBM domain-containing protein n=1 Tax=Heliocybe sulcata TaxID=5364 RepID=A0A5C3N772_9AGAM|nr:hypothetical protein OE88DRAFT_1268076 [Heliocybe sulcata]
MAFSYYAATYQSFLIFCPLYARATITTTSAMAAQDDPFRDWKMMLNNKIAQREIMGRLEYETTSKGPKHDQTWTSIARLNGIEYGRGTGRTKLAAENAASYRVCEAHERDRARQRR